jgi:sugar phosphate isomerase/epimerase
MLREVRDLGFEYAELSHGTRISLVPGILEAVDAGEIKISSLHNFCPLPMGVNHAAPNLYQFSAEREREREMAERYTRKTIEFATRVGARAVVLHLGSIEMKDYTDKLLDLAGRGEKDSPRYERLCAEADEKRESKKEPFFERVKECLKKLLPEAEMRGLRFGAENRESLEELPIDSDFQFLFRELSKQIKENLGFVHHRMQLESLQEHLVGLHIHDVQFPGRDHCPPGTGSIDFAALKPLLRAHHIKVFELSPSLTVEQVKAGVAHLKQIWGDE